VNNPRNPRVNDLIREQAFFRDSHDRKNAL